MKQKGGQLKPELGSLEKKYRYYLPDALIPWDGLKALTHQQLGQRFIPVFTSFEEMRRHYPHGKWIGIDGVKREDS